MGRTLVILVSEDGLDHIYGPEHQKYGPEGVKETQSRVRDKIFGVSLEKIAHNNRKYSKLCREPFRLG